MQRFRCRQPGGPPRGMARRRRLRDLARRCSAGATWFVTARRASPPRGIAGPLAVDLVLFSRVCTPPQHHGAHRRETLAHVALPATLERSAYVWVASALFAWTCLAWQEIPVPAVPRSHAPWRYACIGVQLAGVWMTVRAAGVIDVLDLAGIRQAHGRLRARSSRSSALTTSCATRSTWAGCSSRSERRP